MAQPTTTDYISYPADIYEINDAVAAHGLLQFPKPGYWSNGALATELSSVGLRIVEVKPDGNCLFRALSDQLYVRYL
jgi:hypothetical protein